MMVNNAYSGKWKANCKAVSFICYKVVLFIWKNHRVDGIGGTSSLYRANLKSLNLY